jgi:glycolate oxidase iron-sulfur subunit
VTDALSPADLKEKLDRCVKCGLCLPQCPTFRLSRSENRSPRGRLALIEAVAAERLAPDDTAVRSHLDSCLQCRRCERICPSAVPYGEILDAARSDLLPQQPKRWYQDIVERPERLRFLTLASRLVPAWLSRPLPKLHRQHRLSRALYAEAPPLAGHYPAAGRSRGRVGLFLGCATSAQQGGALRAALRLLTHAGFDVVIPAEPRCCGALAAHSGQPERAAGLREANQQAFTSQCDTIISIASGCGTHIDAGGGFGIEHRDIQAFLLEQGRLVRDAFLPRQQRVALHTPCTVENVYRGGDWAGRLLALIPDLEVVPVGEPGQCCGSAGDYLLRHPETADALRQPVLDEVIDSGAAVLATSNVGCAMHFAAGLATMRHAVEVLHPVEILERQLIDAEPSGYHYSSSDLPVVAS